MPEMIAAPEIAEYQTLGRGMILILQNLGVVTGFALMFLLAAYGGNLEEAIRGHS